MNIETRCGLLCETCPFKESHDCKGCIATTLPGVLPIMLRAAAPTSRHFPVFWEFPKLQLLF